MTTALIIVPTYNEVENIERLVKEIRSQRSPFLEFEVLVVDDGSRDGTDKAVERAAELDPRVHLLERHSKFGLGTAYIAGFRYALQYDYPIVGTMDADFSHDPSYLPALAEAIRNADLVIGSRYVPGGGVRNWGLHRRILSATANSLARWVGGLRTHDGTAGFRLYRTDLLRKLDLDNITSDGYSCLIELTYMCQQSAARIVESPIVFVDRREGQSKISRKEIMKAFATLYRLAVRRWKGQ